MAGKGGGAWKVAYADFVTAMMAFFLVMWIVAQNKSVKEAVSGYFRDPFGTEDKPAGSGHAVGYVPRSKTKTDGSKGGKGSGAGPAPKFEVIRDRHGTSIGAFVLFAETSTELDAVGKERLDELVPLIRGKQNRIEIRAHTARRPTVHGEPPLDDWKVCYDRATVVMKYLESQGVEDWRLRLGLAGPNEPAADASSDLWRVRNSRVELIMMDEYFDDREREEAEAGGKAHDDDHGHSQTSGHAKQDDHGKSSDHGKEPAHGKDAHEKDPHAKDSHGKESHGKESHGKESHAKESAHGDGADHGKKPSHDDAHATDPHGEKPGAKATATPKGIGKPAGHGTSGTSPAGTKPVTKPAPAKGLQVPPTPAASGAGHGH
jgi:chemotaxis protein MotB